MNVHLVDPSAIRVTGDSHESHHLAVEFRDCDPTAENQVGLDPQANFIIRVS
jgi:hypothetical protein